MTLPNNLLLFDGDCGLCNSTVMLLLNLDKKQRIHFSPLAHPNWQTKEAIALLKTLGLEDPIAYQQNPESILLYSNGKLLKRSEAVFAIIALTDSWLNLIRVFRFLGYPFCNFFYNLIAKNRKRFFPLKRSCSFNPAYKGREWLPSN